MGGAYFLAKFQAGGAYSSDVYRKKRVSQCTKPNKSNYQTPLTSYIILFDVIVKLKEIDIDVFSGPNLS